MGTYVGNDSNNAKTAAMEWNDGDWWNPFDGYYEWRSWTMTGKGGSDQLTGGAKNDYIYGDYKLGAYSVTGIPGNDVLTGRGGMIISMVKRATIPSTAISLSVAVLVLATIISTAAVGMIFFTVKLATTHL